MRRRRHSQSGFDGRANTRRSQAGRQADMLPVADAVMMRNGSVLICGHLITVTVEMG